MTRHTLSMFARALALGLALTLGGAAFHARALGPGDPPDRITLKNGKVLEGKITREVEDWIWFTEQIGTVESQHILKLADIEKVERSDPAAKPAEAAVKPAGGAAKARSGGGAPRAAVLTLEGEVGTQFCAEPLRRAIPLLEKDGVEIVVLKVNSGGGSVAEMKAISELIQKEYKARFNTVAWIESAISAAAFSVHCLPDIYFMANGNYGACTAFRMKDKAEGLKGRELEELLLYGEKLSGYGGHPKEIMRAMQIRGNDAVIEELKISPPSGILSADITEDGDVIWHQDNTGEYLLNPQGTLEILTFNSEQALKFKFARAIANDLQELGKAMGYQEIEWVGKDKGEAFPICAAEEVQRRWREETTRHEHDMSIILAQYQREVESARGAQDREDRGAWVNKARNSLGRLRWLWKNYPNFGPSTNLAKDWFDDQDEMLKRLLK